MTDPSTMWNDMANELATLRQQLAAEHAETIQKIGHVVEQLAEAERERDEWKAKWQAMATNCGLADECICELQAQRDAAIGAAVNAALDEAILECEKVINSRGPDDSQGIAAAILCVMALQTMHPEALSALARHEERVIAAALEVLVEHFSEQRRLASERDSHETAVFYGEMVAELNSLTVTAEQVRDKLKEGR